MRCELLSDFVYSFFEHNWQTYWKTAERLWIAFRFCIFVLWTQCLWRGVHVRKGCELLSDFVYSFFEHNSADADDFVHDVVNCFQILYIRSLNTIFKNISVKLLALWIAFRFCIFVLWTQCRHSRTDWRSGCELLSDFVYSFFEHNRMKHLKPCSGVVNCFQILYIRSLNTMHIVFI